MAWHDIWIDDKHDRVRSGWRVLAFLGVALVAMTVLYAFFTLAASGRTGLGEYRVLYEMLINALAATPAALGAGVWALRSFDRLPPHTLGLSPDGRWHRLLFSGFGAGIGMTVLLLLVLWALGLATFNWTRPDAHTGVSLVMGLLLFVIFAIEEELIARGYIFQTLLRGIGPLFTLLATSLGFMLLHLGNPHTTPLGLTNIFLSGMCFGLLYLRSGSLWLPIGLHAGWNFGIILFQMPVSGLKMPLLMPLTAHLSGSPLVVGGAFGPEGGLVASAVMLAAIAVIAYAPVGHPLHSRWWEWPHLAVTPQQPRNWDFTVNTRHYQWKLLGQDQPEP